MGKLKLVKDLILGPVNKKGIGSSKGVMGSATRGGGAIFTGPLNKKGFAANKRSKAQNKK